MRRPEHPEDPDLRGMREEEHPSVIDLPSLLLGAGVGAGGGAAAWWVWARRSWSRSGLLAGPPDRAPPAELPGLGEYPPPPSQPARSNAVAPVGTGLSAPVAARPVVSQDRDPTHPAPETLILSERVLLHLLRLPALGPYRPAELGRTQAGMCERLDIRQGSLTRVLARLEASGALESRRGHVEGVGQRLKVYALTPLGESVARGIRARRAELENGPEDGPNGPRLGNRTGPEPERGARRRSERTEPRLEYIR